MTKERAIAILTGREQWSDPRYYIEASLWLATHPADQYAVSPVVYQRAVRVSEATIKYGPKAMEDAIKGILDKLGLEESPTIS